MKLMIPNISDLRAHILEEHLNKLVKEMCLDLIKICCDPEIRLEEMDPIMPPHVMGYRSDDE